jgi:hypothetical protein
MALTDLSQGVSGGSGIGINDLIDAEIVSYQTITLTNVTNKYFDIAVAPGAGGKLKIYTMEGIALQYGVDYTVNIPLLRVEWTGLTLDGLVAAGDTFQLVYLTTA